MIMRENVPCRLAFGAKLTIVLMALAAVPAWTLGQAAPTPAAGDPQVQAIENQLKALSEKLEAIKAVKKAEGEKAKAAKTFSEAKEFIYLADLNEKQF